MHNANTAYIAIWTGLLQAGLRAYDAPTDATVKYGNLKDPLKKAERLKEAQDAWATDDALAAQAVYGFVRAIGVRLNGVNSVFIGSAADEAKTLDAAQALALRAKEIVVLTRWTSQYMMFRNLACERFSVLPVNAIGEAYFGQFTVPELRTIGYALKTPEHEYLLPYGAQASDEAVTSHLSAALLLLQRMQSYPAT